MSSLIYNKSNYFYMKIYNNTKGKPQEEVTQLLEQLHPEAREFVGKMLLKFYRKSS